MRSGKGFDRRDDRVVHRNGFGDALLTRCAGR
ncbi:hypothetical protein NX02_21670 [Sphingomonas sanxanigenens DSM 19645 = NX02]|uniref:Uncharacterized protein n=1 Tax=Sphingomonas sanxanigenens DSM 19645 = NX02 TaxID=1123269 RepID=W0AJY8_9SPHN|nr:hypothetical protein NX02_21670 [Sphingomonas sanxanigenens DSM 19645 = NX02]